MQSRHDKALAERRRQLDRIWKGENHPIANCPLVQPSNVPADLLSEGHQGSVGSPDAGVDAPAFVVAEQHIDDCLIVAQVGGKAGEGPAHAELD
jgi:hypothetical protein